MTGTALRICPFCEATCGLTLTIEDGRVTGARGDREDVFSAGFICPKGASFAELDNDPDRLSRPMVRRDGVLTEATWDEAFAVVADRLGEVIREHGGASVGVYLGNPNAHTVAGSLYPPLIIRGLGTRQAFSASTLDQMPKHVALGHMFGSPVAFTVPDLDRTDYLVIIGANPLVSNGSLATAADFPGKLRALRKRGGKLTVIDPARTRTAELADRHIAPRPGTDGALLFAVVHVLFEEGLVATDLGGIAEHVNGLDDVRSLAAGFSPEDVSVHCGVPADDIRALARELAAAPTAAVYGRIGTSTVEFGTLASWLVDVINILTGNLDRPGGAMFPLGPAVPAPRPPKPGRGFRTGRWHSRVSGYPEALSEMPTAALAEEIDTPGDGQIKAMITIAGNPVLSAPDGDRLDKALDGVGFMVSIDPYLNETTRHADVILPPPPPSQSPHFDFALNNLAVHNNVRYSPPALPLDGRPDEAEILSRIALVLYGVGVDGDPSLVDEQVIATTLAKETADPDLTGVGSSGRRVDRDARGGRRIRTPTRHDASARTVRRCVRRQAGRPHPRTAQGRTARYRPRPAAATAAASAPNTKRPNRTRTRTVGRRCGAAPRLARKRRRQVRPDRPTSPALQQQLDAQCARAGRWHEPVHAADASRRRRRPRIVRHREDQGARRRTAGADRADARDAPRSGVATARMGSRPRRYAAGCRVG